MSAGLLALPVQGRSNPQKELEGVTGAISVIAIKTVRPNIDGELAAHSDINFIAVRKVAHVTNCYCIHRKNPFRVGASEHELVSRFFHALPSRINRVATALVVCLDSERLRYFA